MIAGESTLYPVLAYFDRPATSNGPTEAMNGGLEHLRQLVLIVAAALYVLPPLWGIDLMSIPPAFQ